MATYTIVTDGDQDTWLAQKAIDFNMTVGQLAQALFSGAVYSGGGPGEEFSPGGGGGN